MRFLQPILPRIQSLVDVDRVVRSLSERISQITGIPLINGRYIEVEISGTYRSIVHGLGRVPNGVLLVKQSVALGVLRSDEYTSTTISLALYPGTSATDVAIWIF